MRTASAAIVLAALLGLTLVSGNYAQASDTEELKKMNQELSREVSALKEEIAGLRTELKSLQAELKKAVAAVRAAKPTQPGKRQRPAMTMIGKKAPEFEVTTVGGEKTKVGGKRDKPQVVFGYASWCGFCKKSLPWIETLHNKYKDKGVEVLALNLDGRGEGRRDKTEEQSLEQFKGMNLSMPMTMTTASNDTKKIGTAYKAQSFPTLFVVGASGDIESVHVGAKAGLENIVGKELDLLLAGKTRADFPK